jgi:Pre-mRNA splicing Prp18-interacting factor
MTKRMTPRTSLRRMKTQGSVPLLYYHLPLSISFNSLIWRVLEGTVLCVILGLCVCLRLSERERETDREREREREKERDREIGEGRERERERGHEERAFVLSLPSVCSEYTISIYSIVPVRVSYLLPSIFLTSILSPSHPPTSSLSYLSYPLILLFRDFQARQARQGGVGGNEMKITVRNLRIREDTPKYLRNLALDRYTASTNYLLRS